MTEKDNKSHLAIPAANDLSRAIEIYLRHAYPNGPSPEVQLTLPEEGFDPVEYLMSEKVQRDPSNAPLGNVRSFGIRLGNSLYPHMKLRLSRPPNDDVFILSVDSHDAFLFAPEGSSDAPALEELKKTNMSIASAVMQAWDSAGLLTERNYLRRKIHQAKDR